MVAFTMEPAQQDGYCYRAVHVLPRGIEVEPEPQSDPSRAYQSTLRITVDGEAVDPEPILREARAAAHARLEILDAVVTAFDRRSEVMAVIADADSIGATRDQIAELLAVTHSGAAAILDLQLRGFSREAMRRLRDVRDDLRGLAER